MVSVSNDKHYGEELCMCWVMMELLRYPTPQLPCTLERVELCTCLGDDGAAAAPHTGYDLCTQGAVCVLGEKKQLWDPTPELTHTLGELCEHLVMTEQLGCPTPELMYTLAGELMFALGDAGAAVAPHTGAVVHSQRCDCNVHLEIRELLWRSHTTAVADAL